MKQTYPQFLLYRLVIFHLFLHKFLLLEITRILTDIKSQTAFMSTEYIYITVLYGSPGIEHKTNNR